MIFKDVKFSDDIYDKKNFNLLEGLIL